MYRIGIANANGDGTGAPTNGPSVVVPMDLALNTDYQIVAEYDPNAGATVWVNPVTVDDLNSGISLDAGLPLTNGISSYAFRQSTGQGKQTVDNVAVGLTFDDVVTNVPVSPRPSSAFSRRVSRISAAIPSRWFPPPPDRAR